MKMDFLSPPLALSLLAILTIIACGLPVSTASPAVQVTATEEIQNDPTHTATSAVSQETITAGPGPSCTVLQDLNLRSGPGTAYRPPIRALHANSVITPLGFAPQGIPSGSWAYVQDQATQDKGWVNAGAQYISCSVELATLPSVAFGTPPPPPLPKSARTSDPDGNGFCVDQPSEYTCVGTFSEETLFQFQILKDGVEQGENDGVESVSFNISRIPPDDPSNKVLVYKNTEKQMSYCVFGGDGPCNGWISEGGVYKWEAGGAPVEPGEYEMEVNATVNGESSRWAVNFALTLP